MTSLIGTDFVEGRDSLSGAGKTRMLNATLRAACPTTAFKLRISTGHWFEWDDTGQTIDEVQATLIAASLAEMSRGYCRILGTWTCFDRYNVAAREDAKAEFARSIAANEARRERRKATVRAAYAAKRAAIPKATIARSPRHTDETAHAAFESLRVQAEADVEHRRRPSWAAPLIIEGKLFDACVALELLQPDDKRIAASSGIRWHCASLPATWRIVAQRCKDVAGRGHVLIDTTETSIASQIARHPDRYPDEAPSL